MLPLLIIGGVANLVLVWPRVRTGPAAPRRVADLVVTLLVLAGLLYGAPRLVGRERMPAKRRCQDR